MAYMETIPNELIVDVDAGDSNGIRERADKPYGLVSEAFTDALAGDTVTLLGGVSDETGLVVPADVTLRGIGPDASIIQGTGDGSGVTIITLFNSDSRITDIGIQGAFSSGTGVGILISGTANATSTLGPHVNVLRVSGNYAPISVTATGIASRVHKSIDSVEAIGVGLVNGIILSGAGSITNIWDSTFSGLVGLAQTNGKCRVWTSFPSGFSDWSVPAAGTVEQYPGTYRKGGYKSDAGDYQMRGIPSPGPVQPWTIYADENFTIPAGETWYHAGLIVLGNLTVLGDLERIL